LDGNPNYPVKIDERKKCQISTIMSNINKSTKQNSSYSVWSANEQKSKINIHPSSQMEITLEKNDPFAFLDISK
jgi:hypothetical protein